MPPKSKSPVKGQRTVQMLTFATQLRRKVTVALKENPTIVTSAAMLAFATLPVEQQLKHIADARQQHASFKG